ncbi:MAG: Hpt domain-containing protein, partial [SAR324 cluster bacterium]|nr:Hpt domain-containing protein [SAR324 cluster bacterium]
MSDEFDRIKEVYREEATERLAELENAMLELEQDPENMDIIASAFRAMHTIKGSGAMFGHDDIAEFTHEVESTYDRVRNGDLPVTPKLIALTLSAHDHIKALLEGHDKPGSVDMSIGEAIVLEFRNLLSAPIEKTQPEEKPKAQQSRQEKQQPALEQDTDPEKTITFRIRFTPSTDIFANGTNPAPLLKELQELGEAVIIADTHLIPPVKEMDPELCYVSWDILLTTNRGLNAIKDVFIFVEDVCEVHIDVIDDATFQEGNYKKLGEILIERGDLKPEDLQQVLGGQKPIGKILEDSGLVPPDKIQSALAEQHRVRDTHEKRQQGESSSSIRVDSEKLDKLVDLVGELVTVQARLTQWANMKSDSDLTLISEEVERLTTELRDNTMSVRMLPIGSTFNKFRRLIRYLSNDLGKKVVIQTEGAETELDDEIFALDIGSIREVLEFESVTRVPQTPDYMKGVINLRGSV